MNNVRIIAFYLPQFHPIKENDEWWGKGFTEWTNVAKAKKLYPKHKQPKIPADLGFYDLRIPDVRQQQVELARRCGVEGFCYWHYYFGNKKQLLNEIIESVYEDKQNTFPYCFGWANESWEKKLWNKDGRGNKVLIEQKYGNEDEYTEHFYEILKYLKDERYITIDGKPLFLIYKPEKLPNANCLFSCWNKLAKENGLKGIYFIAHSNWQYKNKEDYLAQGYDGVYSNEVLNGGAFIQRNPFATIRNIFNKLLGFPKLINFKTLIKESISKYDYQENIFPGILCGWDHTPRSGRKGLVVTNFSKKLFKDHILQVFSTLKNKTPDHRIVFLKSWNEWGEGNFMEPDFEFGSMKIDTLKEAIDEYRKL